MTNLAKAQELFFSALDAQNRKNLDVAENLYKEALAQAPDRPSVLNNLAGVLQLQGKYLESRRCCERLLELNPADATAWMNLGNAQTGLKQVPDALASYDQALAIAPEYAEALVNRASALAMSGRHTGAFEDLACALRIIPDHPEALINRANVLVDLNRPEEALDDYRHVLERDPGNAMRSLRRFSEALQDYARAQTLAPMEPGPYWNEALCRLHLGDFERGWPLYASGWATGQPGNRAKGQAEAIIHAA